MGNEVEARKQAEEDTSEDLELREDDADKVAGGMLWKGGDQISVNSNIKV